MIDWPTRWRDDLAERIAILEAEGIPGAEAKARAMVDRCRRREEQPQEEMFVEDRKK